MLSSKTINKEDNKNSKFEEEESGAVDSGLISEEIADEHEDKHTSEVKEPSLKKDDNQQTQSEITEDNFDSGLVEFEEESFEEENSSSMRFNKNFEAPLAECLESLKLSEKNDLNRKSVSSVKKEKPKTLKQQLWEIYYQQNDDGDTYLHLAVIHGNEKAVAEVIKAAVHPCLFDIQNDMYHAALHLAVLLKQSKIVRQLVVAGADLTVRDHNGNTALHLACSNGDLECVKNLLQPLSKQESIERSNKAKPFRQQNLEQWNYNGEKFVHLACRANSIEVLQCLVEFGADVNSRDGKSGWTALHFAIEQNNEVMANYIMECSKTELETATYAGLTAYQLAALSENQTLLNHLLKCGAEPLSPPESEDEDEEDFDNDGSMNESSLEIAAKC